VKAAVVIGVLVLSSTGLAVLGLSASDAAEARAMLRTREILDGTARSLADAAEAILADADRAADRWDPSDEDLDGLIADIFVLTKDGRIRHPAVQSYPALSPPAAEDVERVRTYLLEAGGMDADTAERLLETAAFEEFAHPDLVATLLLKLADRSREAGNAERAVHRYRSIVHDLPAARDFAGEAIAPSAHLRLIAVLDETGRDEEVKRAATDFALRLADRAFALPAVERELMLAKAAERCEGLPQKIVARREFMDHFGPRIRARATAELGRPGRAAGWRHGAVVWTDRVGLFGWRELEIDGEPHAFGFRIDPAAFRERLEAAAAELAARGGTRIEVALAPPLVVGRYPAVRPIAREIDLPIGLAAAVAVGSPEGLLPLKILHVAMTILLAGSLLAGILFSLHAVRARIRTARLRQNLLDNTGHELRTPLTTIRMYAEMLAEEDLPPEKNAEYLAWILAESERLSLLVDEVLDLSRLSTDRKLSPAVPAAPRELATEAAARVDPTSEGAPIRIEVPEGLPPVLVDRDAAARALANLVNNARKYSDGEIGIDGIAETGFVRLEVWDRGPGIPDADREHLFTKFYRSPRDARKVKGVGIGLVLAREIARALGGDVILVESTPEGSRFALRLPIAPEEGR
jgi:signal transduction histidine kinase